MIGIFYLQRLKNYAYAFPIKILTPSEHRISPKCPYFQTCGGCDFLHVDYSHQGVIKKNIINEFLQKAKIHPANPVSFILSPKPFEYRINTRFRIQNNQFGYFERHSKKVVSISKCPLLDENIIRFAGAKKDFQNTRSVIIKTDNNNNISSNINKNRLKYSVDDLNIYYDYRVFFQANKFLIKKWLELIGDIVSPFNKKRIIELYCGAGIISLYLAKRFNINKITGIDRDNTAVNFARISREKNKLFNVKFISGKVEEAITRFSSANVVIIDPPRSGVPEEVLLKVCNIRPRAVIYLSCQISTFIRDAEIITAAGYKLENLTGLDMFPQTFHFETVGVFVRA